MRKTYDIGVRKFSKGDWGIGINAWYDEGFSTVASWDEENGFQEVDSPIIDKEWRFNIELFKWVITLYIKQEREANEDKIK